MPEFLISAKADLQAARETWLASLSGERRLSAETREAYERDTRQFLQFLTGHNAGPPGIADIKALRPADLRGYLATRRGAGAGPRTLARGLAGIRSLLRFLEKRGLVNAAGAAALRAPKQPKSLPKPLTLIDARRVVTQSEQLAEEPWIAARNAAVLTLLYGLGLRISEALGLAGSDLLPGEAALRVKGKGGKTRLVPVLPMALQAVAEYRRTMPLPPFRRRTAVSRRQGRTAQSSDRPARNGQDALGAQFAGHGDAACAAPFLRDASARPRRRSADNSGAARPCQPVDDADLHRRGHGATAGHLRIRASPCVIPCRPKLHPAINGLTAFAC